MKWTILTDGSGVLTERTPQAIENDTVFEFDGIGAGYTAIFKRDDGNKLYVSVNDGVCSVPGDFLVKSNSVKVALSMFNDDNPIICEAIKRIQADGKSFVVPNDGDLPRDVARIRVELNALRENTKEMTKKFEELLARVEEFEGFDI